MELTRLLENVEVLRLEGDPQMEITGLAYDSRRVAPGNLFFCVPGSRSDGHDHAADAVAAGATALVVERPLGLGVCEIKVENARAAMAPIADAFHGSPSRQLAIAAITGTNGKTTTSWLLREILTQAVGPTGLIGTVNRIVGGQQAEAGRTTPEAIDLQADFRRMVEAGDRCCVIEASSHALQLHRCDSIAFAATVFTNLTQDHLDFHPDMEQYFAAKRRLFRMAPGTGVFNLDDAHGRSLAAEFGGITFSAEGAEEADFRADRVDFDAAGAVFDLIHDGEVTRARVGLPGHFNVANALAAIAAAKQIGVAPARSVAALAEAGQVPGRFEPVDRGQDFTVLVDYAHTPDSLENVLRAARRLTDGRVISVFGAGGDRDRDKRPKMGRAGAEHSDLVFVTSDNPRSEPPAEIVNQVLSGTGGGDRVKAVIDRREAIAAALTEARAGDVVLIAGKGHEQGQEFADGHKIPFDDRRVAAEILERLVASGQPRGAAA